MPLTMRRQTIFLVVIAFLLGFAAGGAVSYYFSKNEAVRLNNQRLELTTILRATDFQNRVSMMRFLREKGVSPDEIATWEISAIALLQTIDVKGISPSSDSGYALKKAAETLRTYRNDFPITEFDPAKRPAVADLMALATTDQRSVR